MRKTLTAAQVKKLPVGTDVFLIWEGTGRWAKLLVIKSGRKKMLKGAYSLQDIADRTGWHYEVEDKK